MNSFLPLRAAAGSSTYSTSAITPFSSTTRGAASAFLIFFVMASGASKRSILLSGWLLATKVDFGYRKQLQKIIPWTLELILPPDRPAIMGLTICARWMFMFSMRL